MDKEKIASQETRKQKVQVCRDLNAPMWGWGGFHVAEVQGRGLNRVRTEGVLRVGL